MKEHTFLSEKAEDWMGEGRPAPSLGLWPLAGHWKTGTIQVLEPSLYQPEQEKKWARTRGRAWVSKAAPHSVPGTMGPWVSVCW